MVSRFERFTTAISSIHRSIMKIQRVEMAKYGLKGPHAQCLLTMSRFPEGITAAQLCELCDKDKAAISRTVAELEEAGMVVRPEGPGKRYRACLKLTEAGYKAAEAVMSKAKVAVQQATGGYGAEMQDMFTATLDLVANNLETICRQGLKEE